LVREVTMWSAWIRRRQLAVAQACRGGERVGWVEGAAAAVLAGKSDLVVPTGQVVQFWVDDHGWMAPLRDIRRPLATGGRSAFESRNVADQVWLR